MKFAQFLTTLWLAFASLVTAQEAAPPVAPPPGTPPPKVITRENTIYVPFEKLEEVFEGQEQGVFLPYREFLEMWNKLNLPDKLKKTEPPVDGVLAGAKYAGTVIGDVAEIKATLNFEALKEGWSSLKLGTGDLGLAEAKTTALLNAAADGHEIIFPNKGAYTLEATVFGRVSRDKGRATLTLKLPKTAVSQFELTVPDKGLEFEVKPASAFSAVEQEAGTKLAVYFGASQEVTISWTKKGGETALPALLFADVSTDVRVSAGALRADATVSYRILRAGVTELGLVVPEGFQVLAVEGQNVKEWAILPGGALAADKVQQPISIKLHTPAKDSYSLKLRLEAPLGVLPQKVKLPEIRATGVERQSGSVAVVADGDLVVEPSELQGLTQQAVAVMKDGRPQPGLVASYRYLRLPYAGTLTVTQAKPQVEVTTHTLLTVGTDATTLAATFEYTVKKAGIFGVQIELPPGFPQSEATGTMVESSTVSDVGGKKVLNVKFKERQIGQFSFTTFGEALRAKADDTVAVPIFNPLGVERHEAKAGLAIHVSLKANTTDRGDLREEDIRNLEYLVPTDAAKTPLTIGFRYRAQGAAPVKPAQVAFELRKPRVSAEVLTMLDIRETLTKHAWTVKYHVEFAGVNEFSIEVPKAIADDLQILGAQIKERIKTEAKDDKGQPTGTVIWRVVLQDKVLGDYVLSFSHDAARAEQKPEGIAVALHEIKALGVFRETGQIAVLKDGNLEITKSDTKGIELIDPKELDRALQGDGIFLAYKYSQHPLALNLSVSKNAYLDVPQAVVTYAVLTTVVAEDEAETTEVVYWVKNNSQQFFSVQLPTRNGKAARLLSDAFVDGVPQQPSKRPDKNEVLIRLPAKRASNAEFSVRFVYEVPSAKPGEKLGWRGSFDLQPPQLADVKVLQTKWTLYLPTSHRYLGFGGAMREKFDAASIRRWPRILWAVAQRLSPASVGEGSAVTSQPPALPEARGAGFDAPLRIEGGRYELRRMESPAAVKVSFRGKTYSFIVEAFAGLLAFIGGAALLRKGPGERWGFFLVVGIGALIISGAVNPRGAGIWQSIFAGSLAAAILWCALACWKAWCRLMPKAPSPRPAYAAPAPRASVPTQAAAPTPSATIAPESPVPTTPEPVPATSEIPETPAVATTPTAPTTPTELEAPEAPQPAKKPRKPKEPPQTPPTAPSI